MNPTGTILLIDDSAFICSTVQTLLSSEQLTVNCVHSSQEGFHYLEEHRPDLILLDMVLQGENGHDICRKLKENPLLADIPVIFLTADQDDKSIRKGFALGAADYVVKPFVIAELEARVSCQLQNKLTADSLRETGRRLSRAEKELRMLRMNDPLTGLITRRYFIEQMNEGQTLAAAGETYLVLVDLDALDTINITHGFAAGDYILYTVADLLERCIGEGGAAVRWDGDQFLLMLVPCGAEEARRRVTRMIRRISTYPFCFSGVNLPCRISAGVARFDPRLSTVENISRAKELLRCAKANGGGRMMMDGET